MIIHLASHNQEKNPYGLSKDLGWLTLLIDRFTGYLHITIYVGLHEHGLTPYTHGYYTGYNKDINPSAASG